MQRTPKDKTPKILGYSAANPKQYDSYEFQLSEKTYLLKTIEGEIVPFGDTKNQFPNELASLLRRSKVLRGIINDKSDLFSGTRFLTENPKLQELIENINPAENQSLMSLHEMNVIDRLSGGNTYMIIISKGNEFVLKHLQDVNCRVDVNGNVVYNPDWTKYNKAFNKVFPLFPNFTDMDKMKVSAIHVKDYERGFNYYGIPAYIAGISNGEIDWRTDAWNLEHVKTGYKTDNVVILPNGATPKQLDELEESHSLFKHGKPGGFFYISAEGAQLVPQNSGIFDMDWGSLNEMNIEKAIIANSWYKSLTSVSQSSGFDTKRVEQDYSLALMKILKDQNRWLSIYKKIFQFFGVDASDLTIYNESILPKKSPEQSLIDMKDFLNEQQKAEIGTFYFDKWKSNTNTI